MNDELLRDVKERIRRPLDGDELTPGERLAEAAELMAHPEIVGAYQAEDAARFTLTAEKPISRRTVQHLVDSARLLRRRLKAEDK